MKKITLILVLLISVCYAQSKAGFYVVGGKIITVQDTSSRKYLKAVEDAGVVPSVIQNFTSNYLVTSEKAIGFYNSITAQYPLIGGSENTHRLNQINPVVSDAGRRLVFPNGATHNANGITFNGTNQFANTFVPQNFNGNFNIYLGIYNRTSGTNLNSAQVDIGAWDGFGTTNSMAVFQILNSGGNGYLQYSSSNNQAPFISNGGNRVGYYSLNRQSASRIVTSIRQSISSPLTTTVAITPVISNTFTIGTISPGDATNLSNRNYSTVIIASAAASDAVVLRQSHIVTFFNSLLGRQ